MHSEHRHPNNPMQRNGFAGRCIGKALPMHDTHQSYLRLFRLSELMATDTRLAAVAAANGGPPARRGMIRTLFAQIEGLVHAMQQTLIASIDDQPELFSREEADSLRELVRTVDKDGATSTRPRPMRTLNRIKAVFGFYSQAFDKPQVCFGDQGWVNFRNATDIRNRLVHPKMPEDLDISVPDMACIHEATSWFNESWRQLIGDVDSPDLSALKG